MKYKELKTLTEKELKNLLITSREKARELRFKDANKQLKDVREIREIKTQIAQILTLLKAQSVKK